MQYTRLGDTGLVVSRLAFGAMTSYFSPRRDVLFIAKDTEDDLLNRQTAHELSHFSSTIQLHTVYLLNLLRKLEKRKFMIFFFANLRNRDIAIPTPLYKYANDAIKTPSTSGYGPNASFIIDKITFM